MPKLGTLALSGESGHSYTFNIYPWGTDFKPLGAVYAVTKRAPAQNGGYTHSVLYVGETGDLSERFADHHKSDCFQRQNANCINILQEANPNTRLHIEADLIEKHQPHCNG